LKSVTRPFKAADNYNNLKTGEEKMKHFRQIPVIAAVILAACGGGSSDSGGGGGSGSTEFAGTYNGSETLTITLLGEAETGTAPLTITINQNGSVTVNDSAGLVYTGTMSGSAFTASGTTEDLTNPEVPGIVCTISQSYQGTVNGSTAEGTTSGTLNCTDGSSDINGSLSGTFTATS
jgi:hypothetical protein